MGTVYLAREVQLDRDVAIKVLPAQLSLTPDPAGSLSLGNPFDRAGRGLKVLASRGARIARRMTGMR